MLAYVIKRVLAIAASLLVASVLVFAIVQVLPGDVAQMILGRDATPESLAALRRDLGLDQPLPQRYGDWIAGVLRGDFGRAISIPGFPVGALIADRAANSLALAALASLLIVPLAIGLGTLAGLRPNGLFDRIVSVGSMITISLPEFASAIFLIILFAKVFPILPSMSILNARIGLGAQLHLLILPALTLSLISTGYVLRMVRASVIEVATSEQVKVATLTGVSPGRILFQYVLRNALAPAVTIIAMNMGWLIGGLVVVETVFAYPGLGSLLLHAVTQRDVPLIQGAALCSVGAYLVMNLIADLIYLGLNPQLRPA